MKPRLPTHPHIRMAILAVPAALGGWVATAANVPLSWLFGAIVVTAALALAGVTVKVPRTVYRSGQLIVAVTVGLTVTAKVAQVILPHLPVLLTGALVSIAIGRTLAIVLSRLGGVERGTAFFAMIPAGISEMAEQSARRDADIGAVAAFHTVRVMVVVLALPPVMLAVFGSGGSVALNAPGTLDLPLLVALTTGVFGALAGSLCRMPAAWFVAPMLTVAVLSGADLLHGRMPGTMLAVAQVALGLALGSRFNRQTMARLPLALGVGVPLMILHAAAMAAVAGLAAPAMGFDLRVVILGLATGGSAEMVLTAKLVGADAAIVAAYQVTRGLLGNLLADPIYRLTVAPRPKH